MRPTAVSSVCASESCAIAAPTTSSSARVRSSSASTSRARSPARSACAARAANAASSGQLRVAGRRLLEIEELEDAERRLPEGQRRERRCGAREVVAQLHRRRPPRLERRGRELSGGCDTVGHADRRSELERTAVARRQSAPPCPPVASTATRTTCAAARPASPPEARASPARSSHVAAPPGPSEPGSAPNARWTRASCEAAMAARPSASSPNGSPIRTSSIAPTTRPATREGTARTSVALARSAARSVGTVGCPSAIAPSGARVPATAAARADPSGATARATRSPAASRTRTTARSASAAAATASARHPSAARTSLVPATSAEAAASVSTRRPAGPDDHDRADSA